MNKVACPVCTGKGGFRKLKQDYLDTNWVDCAYCDGYGFVEDTMTEDDARDFLTFSNYRNKIINELSPVGDVKVLSSEHLGKDMYIQVVPTNKKVWIPFLKMLNKFSAYSVSLTATPKQVFFYDKDKDTHHYYLELYITTDSLQALDGFIELIQLFNDTHE
jgi:hypothetical protein